uniref:ATP synthase complex subunit 8 n=1 Tax=Mesocapromys melanurus TaxID=1567511 RepID=A0A1S5S6U9_9HYST|nr:ATP synthase F0 subunit 8 [Mesocapromys melanurus]
MPQLDTSTWLINILSMLITLLVLIQLKTLMYQYPSNPQLTPLKQKKQKTPWEMKWTKTYLPLS